MSDDLQSTVIIFQSPKEDQTIRRMVEDLSRIQRAQAELSAGSQRDASDELKIIFETVADQRTSLVRAIAGERNNLRIDLEDRIDDAERALHKLIFTDKICAIPETITRMKPDHEMPRGLMLTMHPDSIAVLQKDPLFKNCGFRAAEDTPFQTVPAEMVSVVPNAERPSMALVV